MSVEIIGGVMKSKEVLRKDRKKDNNPGISWCI